MREGVPVRPVCHPYDVSPSPSSTQDVPGEPNFDEEGVPRKEEQVDVSGRDYQETGESVGSRSDLPSGPGPPGEENQRGIKDDCH